jgi:hypothetical protein
MSPFELSGQPVEAAHGLFLSHKHRLTADLIKFINS